MLEAGQTVGHYAVESLIGEGGMGRVYRVHDTRLDRRVALKIVALDRANPDTRSELRARLVREARAAAKVDHPNAVVIHDVGELDGSPYIVMELLHGRSLRAFVGDSSVPVEQRGRWLRDVALALGRAHELGLVHRDIKPENVMLTDDGRIKVLDFGIARQLPGAVDPEGATQSPGLGTLTVQGSVVGTVRYMSPEQVRGASLDGRSDQFSWGVMAYELLTGELPFQGNDPVGYGASLLADAPPPLASVPVPLAEVVLRALEKKPDARFQSMAELVLALDGAERSPGPREAKQEQPRPKQDLARYSTGQVSQILKRAIDLQAQAGTGLGFETLVEVAAEVGVDRKALAAAARELENYRPRPPRSGAPGASPRAVWRLRRHFATWAIFTVFFFMLNVLTSSYWWFLFPVLGWGVGLALHALRVYMPGEPEEGPIDPEVQKGVELLMSESSRRLRVAEERKLRVPTQAPEEEEAVEQEATEDRVRRRRRR